MNFQAAKESESISPNLEGNPTNSGGILKISPEAQLTETSPSGGVGGGGETSSLTESQAGSAPTTVSSSANQSESSINQFPNKPRQVTFAEGGSGRQTPRLSEPDLRVVTGRGACNRSDSLDSNRSMSDESVVTVAAREEALRDEIIL